MVVFLMKESDTQLIASFSTLGTKNSSIVKIPDFCRTLSSTAQKLAIDHMNYIINEYYA